MFTCLGCGELRFSQLAPEAKDFHPRTVALIFLDVGSQEDIRDTLDALVTGELNRKKWFLKVLSNQAFQGLLKESHPLRQATLDYLAKFAGVDFSDPDLSRKIGEFTQIDAFLLVRVDHWYYTKEADKNVVKVGLGMKMINALTGSLMWKAGHNVSENYLMLKPALSTVAADVVKRMVNEMPH